MSLTRPAYTITVENVDLAWARTVTAGDAYLPAEGVWLADGLRLGWRFAETPPAQLEPEVAEFALLADGIANLPAFRLGDRVKIALERPTDFPDPNITYMDFAGRITDKNLTTDAKSGRVLLEITAVDPTSELTHDIDKFGPSDASGMEASWADTIRRYEIGGTYRELVIPPFQYRWWEVTIGQAAGVVGASELIARELAAGLQWPDGFPVQRYVADAITAPDWDFQNPLSGEPAAWGYFLAQWVPEAAGDLYPLFVYAWDGLDADQVTTVTDSDPIPPDGALIALNACYMPDGAEWTTDRTLSPNRIILKGINSGAEATVTVTDSTALERFGAITRTIDSASTTFGEPTRMADLADRYLDLVPTNDAEAWQLRETTILTDKMDDATLDAYAPLFWTPREPVPGVMGKPVVLFGVSTDVDPTDGFLFAHLAGVTFEIADGKLAITPELVPAKAPELGGLTSTSPSYDDFGASAFGNATYHDQGGASPYMDPALTYDRAKLTAL